MAYQSSAPRSAVAPFHGFMEGITSFFSRIGTALVVNSTNYKRLERVEALQAKSDAELAAMNIRREDIVRIVFRDMLHI